MFLILMVMRMVKKEKTINSKMYDEKKNKILTKENRNSFRMIFFERKKFKKIRIIEM